MGEQQPSEWQKKITGEWYGRPSVFDPDGNHVGYERVSRASVFEDGTTRYWMKTDLSSFPASTFSKAWPAPWMTWAASTTTGAPFCGTTRTNAFTGRTWAHKACSSLTPTE